MAKTPKINPKEWLADVLQEKRFWCADGSIFNNLSELWSALKGMSNETFRHHANEAKNDFSNWVRDVIGDEKLADDLKASLTQAQEAKVVAERVAFLKKKAAAK